MFSSKRGGTLIIVLFPCVEYKKKFMVSYHHRQLRDYL
jgi:hypothetical protein